MANTERLAVRVSHDAHARIRSLAHRRSLTESIWLRQVIDAALLTQDDGEGSVQVLRPVKRRDKRFCVRLRPDDRRLLIERAAARGMAPATYVSVLVRAHLHELSPLPEAELRGLTRSVAELSVIGRNLNQIVLAINRAQTTTLPGRHEVLAMLKVCTALRDYTTGLIKVNTESWKVGYAPRDI